MLAVALGFCAGVRAVDFAGGTGTPDDPYQVATADQLTSLGSDPALLDKCFVLVNDIDLDPDLPGGRVFERAVIAPAAGIVHLEYGASPFTGVFDGRGHMIRNLVIEAPSGDWIGLFGCIGEGAQVRNLGLTGGRIHGREDVGALAGACRNGRVFAVYSESPVDGYERIGGLIGRLESGEVRCCYASAAVSGDYFAAGLVGLNMGSLVTSYSASTVRCEGRGGGGLVGANYSDGSSFLCYWDVERAGQAQSETGRGKGTDLLRRAGTYRGWGHDRVWTIDDGKDYPRLLWQGQPGTLLEDRPRAYGGGTGTPEDPYRIRNGAQLATIAWYESDLDKSFVLTADIDFNDAPAELALPIGSVGVPFTGVFDGAGHAIDNVHFACDQEDFIALFGAVAAGANRADVPGGRLLDLRLTNVRVGGRNYVAGLVADNRGVVEQAQVSGHVSAAYGVGGLAGRNMAGGVIASCRSEAGVAGENTAGALVGYNVGRIADCHSAAVVAGGGVGGLLGVNGGAVMRCSATGEVSGPGSAGGLVWGNLGTITACFSTCTVNGVWGVGGFAGSNVGLVLSCYATGSVTGDSQVGGLVGLSNYGIAACCYSTGTVQGKTTAGGLTGGSMSAAHLSYWDVQASGMTTSAAGEGKTTDALMSVATYRGWGCDGAWVIDDGHDYPHLAWEGRPGQPIVDAPRTYGGGAGTMEDPYQIRTAEQFAAIGWYYADYTRHFVLLQDLDVSPLAPDLFAPIGRRFLPFTGTFDGQGHTIANWALNSRENYIGVFGYIQPIDPNQRLTSGLVKDLHLTGLKATGLYCVGGLAGASEGAVVSCTANGAIGGDRYIGGLLGENAGYVEGCQSVAQVSGKMGVGGLTGLNEGTILSSQAQGKVEGDSAVGGLTGYNDGWDSDGAIRSCHSEAEVSGKTSTGGLIGSMSKGAVTSCNSTGSVAGEDSTGGLIGCLSQGTVAKCYATGKVIGNLGSDVGGLVGWNAGGIIEECFAAGPVEGQTGIGGLVGRNTPDGSSGGWPERTIIRFCYAQGDVHGTENVGGLVGSNDRGTVYGCYSTGQASGTKTVGGLVGKHVDGPVRLCYWDVQTSGLESSAAGGARTTAQLMTADTFLGWGDGIWRIDEGHDYPHLAWEQRPGELIGETSPRYGGGSGTAEDPYQIWTAAQLVTLAYYPEDYDKHFALKADLDFAGVDPNWIVPIGMDLVPFLGVFEGNGHSISNFTYQNPTENYAGLFGCLGPMFTEWTDDEGVVRNLHLVGVRVQGSNSVGALVGYSFGTIVDCSVSGEIEGRAVVGGLVGANWGVVERCGVDGVVSGTQYTGGLVGRHMRSRESRPGWLHACRTTGQVRGDLDTGGIAGASYGIIESCYSQAHVAGGNRAGGLLGTNEYDGVVARCYSAGAVTGTGTIGGLVGFGSGPLTVMSYWDVEASGVASSAGGYGRTTSQMFSAQTFAGWGSPPDWTIQEGVDYPRLAWENFPGATILAELSPYGGGIGGLVGYNSGSMTDCYAISDVTGHQQVGGLIGVQEKGECVSCFWDVSVSRRGNGIGSGIADTDNVLGRSTRELQTARLFRAAGWDFESIWTICEGRDYPRLRWEEPSCPE